MSALLIVAMLSAMLWVRRHYGRVADETRSAAPLAVVKPHAPIVIVPIQDWDEFALTLST